MDWKDTRRSGQLRQSELWTGELMIIVHRHIYYSDRGWLFSCEQLGLNAVPLDASGLDDASLEAAKAEAIDRVCAKLRASLDSLKDRA